MLGFIYASLIVTLAEVFVFEGSIKWGQFSGGAEHFPS
jgi:hypothetical protein